MICIGFHQLLQAETLKSKQLLQRVKVQYTSLVTVSYRLGPVTQRMGDVICQISHYKMNNLYLDRCLHTSYSQNLN